MKSTLLLVLCVATTVSACAVKAVRPQSPPPVAEVKKDCSGYDCRCENRAMNLMSNKGLWGGKPSFKDTLTPEGWARFEKTVKEAHLEPSCEAQVLKEAAELPEGQPVLLNILIFMIKSEAYGPMKK